ncbi:hypothetical protein ATSB10_30310 [Dyella thiooxydans]|uniref:Uncharacterized protein n=1 Tax=Dyella thiooxydans TaxID=445710 RepID=A0A161J9V0_9GAMM|nr:hypothetical protein ATSB10_30310 [Dyella thiooxydans]
MTRVSKFTIPQLVDMGDRRSAALQLSDTFREIKLTLLARAAY